jgi:hypothetical protein
LLFDDYDDAFHLVNQRGDTVVSAQLLASHIATDEDACLAAEWAS